jgi:membrane-associated phospholipid phosphatase
LTGLDQRLERFIVGHRWGPIDWVFVWLSRLGAGGAVWIVLALVVLVVTRRRAALVGVVLAVILSAATVTWLQDAIGRRRPPRLFAALHPLVRVPQHGSFPSGHTTTAFACALVLAAAVRRPLVRAAFFLLAAAIGFSRLYVGVHFPLDVLGGALLGLAYGALALQLVGGLEHARDDHAQRGYESDPESDPASGRDNRERHPDQPVEDEHDSEDAETDQHEALRQARGQDDPEAP